MLALQWIPTAPPLRILVSMRAHRARVVPEVADFRVLEKGDDVGYPCSLPTGNLV